MWNAVTETGMPDMKHKESEIFGRHMCTCVHTPLTHTQALQSCTNAHWNSHTLCARVKTRICADTQTNMHVPGFLRLLLCFVSRCYFTTCGAIISWHTYPPLNEFPSSTASHLIKVESLMPFRHPTAFKMYSLSLWKWMAAAENSDVLSHHDRESLNVSCDLYRRCLWLKVLVGD